MMLAARISVQHVVHENDADLEARNGGGWQRLAGVAAGRFASDQR
jgi:hypothetical protein